MSIATVTLNCEQLLDGRFVIKMVVNSTDPMVRSKNVLAEQNIVSGGRAYMFQLKSINMPEINLNELSEGLTHVKVYLQGSYHGDDNISSCRVTRDPALFGHLVQFLLNSNVTVVSGGTYKEPVAAEFWS
jgi:hypothetical protein